MKHTVHLDKHLEKERGEVTDLVKEKPAIVLRMAIREGLSVLRKRFTPEKQSGQEQAKAPQKRT